MQGPPPSVGDPGRAHAHRRHLGRARPGGVEPDPGVLGQPAGVGHAEGRERVDHHLLEAAHVVAARRESIGHGQDRVDDQLARAVVGDVAAAVGAHELGPERLGIAQHVGRVGPDPEREDVAVLEDEQIVVAGALGEGPLERVCLLVADSPEASDAQHRGI